MTLVSNIQYLDDICKKNLHALLPGNAKQKCLLNPPNQPKEVDHDFGYS